MRKTRQRTIIENKQAMRCQEMTPLDNSTRRLTKLRKPPTLGQVRTKSRTNKLVYSRQQETRNSTHYTDAKTQKGAWKRWGSSRSVQKNRTVDIKTNNCAPQNDQEWGRTTCMMERRRNCTHIHREGICNAMPNLQTNRRNTGNIKYGPTYRQKYGKYYTL